MNKARRKNLQEILDIIDRAKADLEELMGEEEEYRDNMPENLQGSERYEKAEEACDALSEAIDYLDETLSYIETAME